MCLIYIRDSLNEVNRLQPMLLSAIWIMYGHLLIEQNKVPLSTDIIHNHLTNVVCRHRKYSYFDFNLICL